MKHIGSKRHKKRINESRMEEDITDLILLVGKGVETFGKEAST